MSSNLDLLKNSFTPKDEPFFQDVLSEIASPFAALIISSLYLFCSSNSAFLALESITVFATPVATPPIPVAAPIPASINGNRGKIPPCFSKSVCFDIKFFNSFIFSLLI